MISQLYPSDSVLLIVQKSVWLFLLMFLCYHYNYLNDFSQLTYWLISSGCGEQFVCGAISYECLPDSFLCQAAQHYVYLSP